MEYKGELKGFPKEVVNKMLERQEEQGNQKDLTIFERNKDVGKNGNGFIWSDTLEGFEFWKDVIRLKNFDLFFRVYPKQNDILNLPLEEKKKLLNLLKESIKEDENIKVNDYVMTTGNLPIIGKVNAVEKNNIKIGPYLTFLKEHIVKIDPNKTVKELFEL